MVIIIVGKKWSGKEKKINAKFRVKSKLGHENDQLVRSVVFRSVRQVRAPGEEEVDQQKQGRNSWAFEC